MFKVNNKDTRTTQIYIFKLLGIAMLFIILNDIRCCFCFHYFFVIEIIISIISISLAVIER